MTKKRGRPRSSTNTPAKTTLFCLVHGKPPGSFFSVTVGNHKDLDGFRKLIKKENEPDFDEVAPRRLKLWIVDIPFNSPNLGDSGVNITNALGGREFLPSN